MADITERIVIPEVPRVLDGQELYVYIPEREVNSYTKAETDALFAHLVNGKVPESQLPSYVDDVLEYDNKSDFPTSGETGKIYVDKSTNLTYRWSGSTYIMVGGGDLNLENGIGLDTLVLKYSGVVDEAHYASSTTGESDVCLGEANTSSGKRNIIAGKLNKNTSSNTLIVGLRNTVSGNYSIIGGTDNNVTGRAGGTAGTNNTVEGYNDSVSFIKKVIENASEEQNIERRNMQKG